MSDLSMTALLLGLALVTAAEPARAAPQPAAILGRALKQPDVAYRGRLTTTHWYGRRTRSEEVLVHFAPPNRYRWEFITPAGQVGRVVVSDGEREEIRLVGRSGKLLHGSPVKGSAKLMDKDRERNLLESNYLVSLRGGDRVAGRKVWVLELTPRTEGKPHQEMWVDERTGIVLRSKRFHPNGSLASLSSYERFDVLPKAPQDALFRVSAEGSGSEPHGLNPDFLTMQDFVKTLGRRAAFPTELPQGFIFESAGFLRNREGTVAHARYTDGLVSVSLFETDRAVDIAKGGRGGRKEPGVLEAGNGFASPSGHILRWRRGGHHYTLIGDLSVELLESLRQAALKTAKK